MIASVTLVVSTVALVFSWSWWAYLEKC